MYHFNAGALADITPTGKFNVVCPNCSCEIGTMDGATLQEAIFITLGRGGVLCPTCRQGACDFCGKQKPFSLSHGVGHDGAKIKICLECELQLSPGDLAGIFTERGAPH